MDEHAYRAIHRDANPVRCVFAKTILSARFRCGAAQKMLLAERETVACIDNGTRELCQQLLELFAEKSRFALRRMDEAPLTHGQTMRIQIGGLTAVKNLSNAPQENGDDVRCIVKQIRQQFHDFESLPFDVIMREIVHIQWRGKK
ncbi:MAG: hypothetical protein AABY83_04505 [Pseudomonadota bacterium]